MLGLRSAIEWIIDRYRVKTDKASAIGHDPNEWSSEVSDPGTSSICWPGSCIPAVGDATQLLHVHVDQQPGVRCS